MKIHSLHSWDLTPKKAIQIQIELAGKLEFLPLSQKICLVAGADISCSKKDPLLYAAVVVLDITTFKIIEVQYEVGEVSFPYIPGLLGFRELPILCKAFEKIESKVDVVVCDGQGIAHPRRLGLAAHLGLFLNIPTIGCAKSRLVGDFDIPAQVRWATSPLIYKENEVGKVMRSRLGVNPLFISPGNRMDIEGSIGIVKQCTTKYRLPEPTRLAHLFVNRLRKMYCMSRET
jgi:deoxyribonuclease V